MGDSQEDVFSPKLNLKQATSKFKMCFKSFSIFLIIAVVFASRVNGYICPFEPDYGNKDLNEANFLGLWYPHFFISNYDVTTEDIDRFSCTIYNVSKDEYGHYSMKPTRYNPKYKDDMKLHMYDDFISADADRFGSFWHREQRIGNIATPSIYITITELNVTRRYMILLTCAMIPDTNLAFDGLILSRNPVFYDYDPMVNMTYDDQVITRIMKELSDLVLTNHYMYTIVEYEKLTQNVKICEQFSKGFNLESGSLLVLFSTFLISLLIM